VPLALLALLSLPGESTPSWRRSGPDGGLVRAIAIDGARPGTLYAATGGGVFKTTDGGESWADGSAGLPSADVSDVVIDPATPTTLWAATAAGLAKSTDSAASWTTVSLPADTSGTTVAGAGSQEAVQAVAIEPARPSTLYAMSLAAVCVSADGGETWVRRATPV